MAALFTKIYRFLKISIVAFLALFSFSDEIKMVDEGSNLQSNLQTKCFEDRDCFPVEIDLEIDLIGTKKCK